MCFFASLRIINPHKSHHWGVIVGAFYTSWWEQRFQRMDGHNQAVWLIYVRKDFEVLQLWIFYQIKRLQVLFAEVLITQNTEIWKYTKERAENSKITLTSFAGK